MESEEIRSDQVNYILAHMDQVCTERHVDRCIFLGDFNADPYPVPDKRKGNSGTGDNNEEKDKKEDVIPPLAVESVRAWHDHALESVYPLPAGEISTQPTPLPSTDWKIDKHSPLYTTCKYRQGKESKHVIDYIFYTHQTLQVSNRLGALDEEEIAAEGKPLSLPNLKYPSDHISLVADMEIL